MSRPWYPFYWSDYGGKTIHLSLCQHGAYFMLLRFHYTTERPIPHEQRYSIARAMLKHERSAVDMVLGEFFRKDGNFWVNDRAMEVINASEEAYRRRAIAGSKGGKQSRSNAEAMLKQPQPQPQPQKKEKGEPRAARANEPEKIISFPDWWPTEEWVAFVQVRSRSRHPVTDDVSVRLISKLTALRDEGNDPAEVINEAIMNGWRGFFPLRRVNGNGRNGHEGSHIQTERIARKLAAEFAARDRARDIGGNGPPRISLPSFQPDD